MLVEHFASGNMDSGADFGTSRLDWEWDNVMMLSAANHMNRKLAASDWSEEATAAVVVSGPAGSHRNSLVLEENSSKAPLLPGGVAFASSAVKHECQQLEPDEIQDDAPCLDLTRSKVVKKLNGVIGAPRAGDSNSGASSQHKDFFLGLGGGAATDKAEIAKSEGAATTNQVANGGDAETGLKLALKRTFSPDSPATAPSSNITSTATTTSAAGSGSVAASSATNKGGNLSSSPGKKPRGSANHTPRCQVEGCKTDLSSAKDYHRRHKVCAMHSKSAKVCVNSIEQRFCQQCSRFHILSEFDEGKRSCRRRLAGHNERRRKPQPDPMALTTAALAPYQAGFMRLTHERLLGYGTPLSYLGVDSKLAWPRFGNIDDHSGLVSGSSNISRPERFFMLFPPRKGPIVNGIGHQFMQGSGSMGQNLSLSSSGSGVYASGIGPPPNQASSQDSGRALSLLSSQSWAAAASPHDSMEQLMSESRAPPYSSQQQPPPPPQQQSSYSGSATPARQSSYASQVLSQQQVSLSAVSLDSGRSERQQQQQQQQQQGGGSSFLPQGMNNYENHSVLTLLQEPELRGLQDQHARPTIDLMQMSTAQPPVVQQQQQQQNSSDFQVLKPYGSGLYDPHQL